MQKPKPTSDREESSGFVALGHALRFSLLMLALIAFALYRCG